MNIKKLNNYFDKNKAQFYAKMHEEQKKNSNTSHVSKPTTKK